MVKGVDSSIAKSVISQSGGYNFTLLIKHDDIEHVFLTLFCLWRMCVEGFVYVYGFAYLCVLKYTGQGGGGRCMRTVMLRVSLTVS